MHNRCLFSVGGNIYHAHSTPTARHIFTMANPEMKSVRTSILDPVKGLLLDYLMPESCYDEFFLDFNFLDGE